MTLSMHLAVALLGSGVAWATHLLGSYAVIALACATGWSGARPALIALTMIAAAIAIAAGLVSRGRGPSTPPLEDVLPFVRQVGLALSALFTFLIVVSGVVPLMAPLCAPAS